MIRVVLDTNVLVSGFVRRHADAPAVRILDSWRAGYFQLVISETILDEVGRTLRKPYFSSRLSEDQIENALLLLRRRAVLAPISGDVTGVASHPEDDLILDAAVTASADVLVTGDAGLLALVQYRGVSIRTPRDFSDLQDRNA